MFRLSSISLPKSRLSLDLIGHRISKSSDKLYQAFTQSLNDRFKFADSGALLVIKDGDFNIKNAQDLAIVNSTARLAYRYNEHRRCDVIAKQTAQKLVTVVPKTNGEKKSSDASPTSPSTSPCSSPSWLVSTVNRNTNFPHHYRNLSDPDRIEQETGHKGVLQIAIDGKWAETSDLKSAIDLAHQLLPFREDLLNLKIYPFESKKFDHFGYFICKVTDSQPFSFPTRWRGLDYEDLETVANCDGLIFADPTGQKILCKNQMVASRIAAIAFDKIKSDYLTSRFMNIFSPGVLLLDKYILHWQRELFEFERKIGLQMNGFSVADEFMAKLVVYPSRNVVDEEEAEETLDPDSDRGQVEPHPRRKFVVKTIKTLAFSNDPGADHRQTDQVSTPVSLNDEKNETRFVFPLCFRGHTLQQFLVKYPEMAGLFDMFNLRDPGSVLFDSSGHAMTCSCIEDARLLAMGILDYWPTFERLERR